MIQSLFVSLITKAWKAYRDFVFPPFCLDCRERCETKVFCPSCWQSCAPPDPVDRCRHCFEEKEGKGNLCRVCKRAPALPIARAYVFEKDAPILRLQEEKSWACFALYQWVQLDWPVPDVIVPMPGRESIALARAFASFLPCPVVQAIRSDFSCKLDWLEENQVILILDVGHSVEYLKKAISSLSETFPKRMFLLTLWDDYFSVL